MGEDLEIDIDDWVEKLDFGLIFGLETAIKDTFNIGLRYSLGLKDIRKNGVKSSALKNRSFSLVFGYKF